MTDTAPTSTTAEWRKGITITLTRADGERFHRLSSGEILDDQGRGGADFVPDWAVDSLTPNAILATPAEIAAELASPGPRGSFLDLLNRRAAIVETIVGPSPEDDAVRLDVVAALERRMIADPPRTAEEIAGALTVVRDEICDGFLASDTIEDFLAMIVEAAAEFVADHAVQRT